MFEDMYISMFLLILSCVLYSVVELDRASDVRIKPITWLVDIACKTGLCWLSTNRKMSTFLHQMQQIYFNLCPWLSDWFLCTMFDKNKMLQYFLQKSHFKTWQRKLFTRITYLQDISPCLLRSKTPPRDMQTINWWITSKNWIYFNKYKYICFNTLYRQAYHFTYMYGIGGFYFLGSTRLL